MGLTEKQESFCRAYIETGNKSKAYRQAYDADGMAMATINNEAYMMFKNHDISMRVIELQEEMAERHAVTVDSITLELDTAKDLALEEKQPAAMTGAITAKAKLHGLMIEKKELTGKDGGDIGIDAVWRIEVVEVIKND